MDRFFYYLIGAMAALLIAACVVFFMRPRPVMIVAEPPESAEAAVPTRATPVPTLTPRPWSGTGSMAPATPMPIVMATPEPTPVPVPWAPPKLGKTVTVIYPGFTVVYSETLGSPVAVQYAMVQGAKPKRYPQPAKVKTPAAKLITDAGYARGEMAYGKSISLYFGKQSGANTKLMTNISAMDPATADGPWAQLSELELSYSGEYKWIEMAAGPIFGNPPVGVGSLAVPVAFYRVYRRSFGDTMAFVIPQGATSPKMESYLTSVAAVEGATGIAIFANTLTPDQRTEVAPSVW